MLAYLDAPQLGVVVLRPTCLYAQHTTGARWHHVLLEAHEFRGGNDSKGAGWLYPKAGDISAYPKLTTTMLLVLYTTVLP